MGALEIATGLAWMTPSSQRDESRVPRAHCEMKTAGGRFQVLHRWIYHSRSQKSTWECWLLPDQWPGKRRSHRSVRLDQYRNGGVVLVVVLVAAPEWADSGWMWQCCCHWLRFPCHQGWWKGRDCPGVDACFNDSEGNQPTLIRTGRRNVISNMW